MEKYIITQDGINMHYRVSETKRNAIVFVHGWLGNADWWNSQYEYFKDKYTVALIDLPSHGKSEKGRINWSSTQYAKDIQDIVEQIVAENIILVGHSMSGAYTLQASINIPRVSLVVLVDTIKNMDKLMDYHQANDFLFKTYKQDFNNAVKNFLPKFLFSESTPTNIIEQLQAEFLKNDVDFAVKSIEPLYKINIRDIAKQVQVPVRAINSSFTPTDIDSIRRYIKDFDFINIPNSGHYPMIEQPNVFNFALNQTLKNIY